MARLLLALLTTLIYCLYQIWPYIGLAIGLSLSAILSTLESRRSTLDSAYTLLVRNVTLDEFVQDYFGTLLAIRLPGGEQRDISYGLALNHVNLFRHVFAYLNDDPDILKTREEPSLSRFGELILGRDNHPVLELER